MKKARLAILLSTILVVSLTCVYAFCADVDAESPGPAGDGDGIPDGAQWGPGPAPSAGDGEQEGPEWPDWP